ncbi:hypothetical protein IBA8401_30690 [Pseudomonas syringae]|uniref:N-6 DNA methylase n=1 Tax=Pseudomonas syringae TaxID=317 RepID=UPI0032E6911D
MNFMINESAQKLRGGYYTPLDIASFLSKWVLSNGNSHILEPSCGDGIFFDRNWATVKKFVRQSNRF